MEPFFNIPSDDNVGRDEVANQRNYDILIIVAIVLCILVALTFRSFFHGILDAFRGTGRWVVCLLHPCLGCREVTPDTCKWCRLEERLRRWEFRRQQEAAHRAAVEAPMPPVEAPIPPVNAPIAPVDLESAIGPSINGSGGNFLVTNDRDGIPHHPPPAYLPIDPTLPRYVDDRVPLRNGWWDEDGDPWRNSWETLPGVGEEIELRDLGRPEQ